MSTCVVPQNQPIVQALLDKATSYPADKSYQAKAYKKAAESVAAYNLNLYEISEIYPDKLSGVGLNIEGFIYDFIEANPPVTAQPVAPVSEPVVVNEPIKTCTNPTNQPIYQALLDKTASYSADKIYQIKAYKKAAEYVAAMKDGIYDERGEFYGWWCAPSDSSIGWKIEEFINEFLKANPKPADILTGAAKAMDDARKAAAAAAPKDVTTWPNDDAERSAFQQRLAASKGDEPAKPSLTRSIACGGNLQYCGHPECSDNTKTTEPITEPTKTVTAPKEPENPMIASNYLNDAWHVEYMKKWRAEEAAKRAEYLKTPVYTPENPRRSKRNISKPAVKYFTEEDEQDEIAEAIEAFCAKKGYEFSDDLVTDFTAWLPTASDIYTIEYDWKTDKSIPKSKTEIAKEWLMYISNSIQQQKKQQKLNKAIVKYCEKKGFEYNPLMDQKFTEWKADPANKKLITTTYSNYGGCTCSSCDPTGTKKNSATEYSYERSTAYCVNKWFSTLKKTVIL
jgi:hypothetical protein